MQTMFPAVVFWLTNLQNNLTVDVWNEASQHYFVSQNRYTVNVLGNVPGLLKAGITFGGTSCPSAIDMCFKMMAS